jgi:hypothetical protein
VTPDGAHARYREARIRALLAEHAATVVPGDGLPVIRARIARRPWWRRLIPTRTNGAPAATGTPPNTTAEKEPTMAHTLQSESTPRGRQMSAALALAHLLETGPDEVVIWRIDDLGRLHGHVSRPHSDAQARAAVHKFAGFLGNEQAERSQGRNDRAEWIHLHTSGTYRGVQVNVWTHVDVRAISPYSSFGGAA